MDYDVDVAILGAGTAGMAAYREAVKFTDRVALIDGGELGTTCAKVGCMPSKLLIAAAEAKHRAEHTDLFGVSTGAVTVDGDAVMERLKRERDRFVGFVHDALDGFDQDHIVRQHAKFLDDNTLELSDGSRLTARSIVIATGSRPFVPEPFEAIGDRLVINDDVFHWDTLPGSVAVVGAGVIGLEIGQALHRLNVRTRLFGRNNSVGPLSDPDIVEYSAEYFQSELPANFDTDIDVRRDGDEVVVSWNGGEERFDYLLVTTGRRANVDNLGLENTSVERDERGVPVYDRLSMRSGESDIFVAGDSNADLPLLHEAADEGRIAGENAARYPHSYRRARRTPLSIVFCDPQIAVAGQGYGELKSNGIAFETGSVSYEDQGRARVMGVNRGILRVYGDVNTNCLLGAEMIAPNAEHLSHLLAWAIESRLTVSEILERPFYHPVLEEGVRTALRNLNHALGYGPNPPLRCIDCGPGG